MTRDSSLVDQLANDFRGAEVSDADMAMLGYAEKLTLNPSECEADDVDKLRAMGFSDAAVLDIVQVVSYYNYVNRLADGLGVQLEDRWSDEA